MKKPSLLPPEGMPKLFRIGVKPLGDAPWFDVDWQLPAYLDEKQHLAATRFGEIFAAEADTAEAQSEVLGLTVARLLWDYPEIYRQTGQSVQIVPAGRQVRLDDADQAPLWIAARLVPEDLVLMRKGAAGWRIAAAALCFPSSWRLSEKFGKPMHEVHKPVPGFGAGTRNAQMIERMFDNLRPETPVVRWNWSLYGDNRLFHPEDTDANAYRFGETLRAENVFLRAERQTLTRLPESGDIVFTIRIYVDPLAELEKQVEGAEIARDLIGQLGDLDDAQLAYKGLTLERERLLELAGGRLLL